MVSHCDEVEEVAWKAVDGNGSDWEGKERVVLEEGMKVSEIWMDKLQEGIDDIPVSDDEVLGGWVSNGNWGGDEGVVASVEVGSFSVEVKVPFDWYTCVSDWCGDEGCGTWDECESCKRGDEEGEFAEEISEEDIWNLAGLRFIVGESLSEMLCSRWGMLTGDVSCVVQDEASCDDRFFQATVVSLGFFGWPWRKVTSYSPIIWIYLLLSLLLKYTFLLSFRYRCPGLP